MNLFGLLEPEKIPKTNELSNTVKKLKKTLKINYGRKKTLKFYTVVQLMVQMHRNSLN